MNSHLDGIETFVAVVEAKGFRAAGKRLGVSGAAVSQALRRLEGAPGRGAGAADHAQVRITEAGERLYAAVRPAALRALIDHLLEMRQAR